jgi:hypothetical protein
MILKETGAIYKVKPGSNTIAPATQPIIALLIMRYLIAKNGPVSFRQMNLELNFCNICDNWDMAEDQMKANLKTLVRSGHIEEINGTNGDVYYPSGTGIDLMKCFVAFITNIDNAAWRP